MNNRRALRPVYTTLVVFLVIFAAVGFYFVNATTHKSEVAQEITPQLNTATPGADIPIAREIVGGNLSVTGNIETKGGISGSSIIITPSSGSAPVAGQLYVTDSNTLRYFDGSKSTDISSLGGLTEDVAALRSQTQLLIGSAEAKGIITLQGQTGDIVLTGGSGMNITGTTISNTGVISIGGMSGNLGVGSGLSVVGGTLLNTGVTHVVSGSSDITVTQDASGTYTVGFDGSGLAGTVALGSTIAQQDGSNNPTIWINKTGVGNLLQLSTGSSPVNKFVVDQSGAILTGTISFNQVTGVPNLVNTIGGVMGDLLLGPGLSLNGKTISASGVLSIGGLSGTVTLGNGLAVNGGQLTATASGVGSVTGTPNQVIVTGTDAVVLSLPQNISTNSAPLFDGLTLTNALAVTSGGTGATNSADARNNLGAAKSGTNNDITSLTGVTSIASGAALTVGSTGQNLTLQGASTVVASHSGSFSTQLSFATSTANVTYRLQTAAAGTYDVCTTAGNCVGVGGGISSPGGTVGTLSRFISGSAIGDSIITDNGSTVSIAGALSVNTITPTAAAVIGATTQSLALQGSTTTISSTNGTATNTLSFVTPSGVAKSIVIPNASGTVAVSANGPLALDANGNLTCPSCLTSGGGGGNAGVSSVNGISGSVTIATTTGSSLVGSGSTITIQDASSTVKGLAAFDSTNLKVTDGLVNTVQDITTTSTPTFAGMVLNGAGGLTLGSGVNAGSLLFRDGSSNFTNSLVAGTYTANRNIIVPNANGTLAVSASGNIALSGTGNISFTGTLPVTNGGTGATSAAGARGNLGAAVSGVNNDITSLTGLTTVLSVPQGGTGTNSFVQNGVLVGQGASGIATVTAGSAGQCLVSTTGAPVFQSCPGAGGVSSVNTITGAITLTGTAVGSVSTAGNAITINDATSSTKGLASFNATNLTVVSGAVNTIQGISPSASPSFNGLTLTQALGVASGGTGLNSTPQNGQLLIGNGSGYSLNTLSAGAGVTINSTGGAITISSPGSGTCTSCASQALSNLAGVAINTHLLPSTNNSRDLGSAGLAFRNGYFTGTMQTSKALFKNTADSTTALQVQNAAGASILIVDAVNKSVNIGAAVTYNLYVYGLGDGFSAPASYSVMSPYDIISADFNGDGISDLVTINRTVNTISVFVGNGDGTFLPKVDYASGASPGYGITADFNGDGALDLVVANQGDYNVTVHIGGGDGTFLPRAEYRSSQYGSSTRSSRVAVIDLDSDNKLDLVVSEGSGSTTSVVLYGNGNGTFKSLVGVSSLPKSSASLVVVDLNNDSKDDFAVIPPNNTNTVSIFLSNGNGTFQPKVDYAAGNSRFVTAADFNGDGKVDLVTANTNGHTASILLGNGDGTFQPKIDYATGSSPQSITTADFNGDGKVDLATTGPSGASILLGNGDGTLQTKVDYATGSSPLSITTADFNGDGRVDLATANGNANTISILLNGATIDTQIVTGATSIKSSSGTQSALLLQADANQSVDIFRIQNATSEPLFKVAANGNIAIGNVVNGSTPTHKLSVAGSISATVLYQQGNQVCDLTNNCNYIKSGTTPQTGNFNLTGSGTLGGNLTVKTATDSTTAVQVQNAAGTSILAVDTVNKTVNIGAAVTYNLYTYNPATGFSTGANYATGTSPQSVTTADFNGDGNLDLATANAGPNNISVLLSLGNNTFQPKVDYTTGTYPRSVTTADFNGDGKADLATSNQGANTTSILLGNGDGTFQPKVDYTTGTYPQSITTADFNGDGKTDLAIANRNANSTSVLLGNGNGTFLAKVDYTTGASPQSITTADFNGDGKTDLATSNQGANTTSILLGNGDGTFQPKVDYATGTYPNFVTTADFNGDSRPDLTIANNNADTISVLLGNGDGTFQPKVDYATYDPESVTTADFNGDTRVDIATSDYFGRISILLGNGDGTFQPQTYYSAGLGGGAPVARVVIAADFNNDGKPDMAAIGSSSHTVGVLINGASVTTQVISAGTSISSPSNLQAALVVQGAAGQTTDIFRVQNASGEQLFGVTKDGNIAIGAGSVSTTHKLNVTGSVNATALYQQGNKVCDLTNNCNYIKSGTTPQTGNFNLTGSGTLGGNLTVKTATDSTTAVQVQNAAGTSILAVDTVNKSVNIGAPVTYNLHTYNPATGFSAPVNYATGTDPISVTTADFNGDSIVDTAIINDGANTISILLGNGDGTFQSRVDYVTSSWAHSVTATDLNDDNKIDLAVSDNVNIGTVSIYIGNGDGTFQPRVSYATGSQPYSATITDFNGDGTPDLATANWGADTISVLLGNGDGTFQPKVDYAAGTRPTSITAADFNGDGKFDLATTNSNPGTISILLGNGDGTFQPKVDYTTGTYPRSVTTADFNGDGNTDLANANNSGSTISILLGNGDGTFQPKVDYTVGNIPTSITTSDFNGDGTPDLATANYSSNNTSVLLGNGDGTFQPKVDYAAGTNPQSIATADLNGDGKSDLVTANYNSDNISILINGATVTTQTITAGTSISSPSNLQAALVVQGAVGQATDVFRVQKASGEQLLGVTKDGNIAIGASPASTVHKLNVTGSVNATGYSVTGLAGVSFNCGTAQTINNFTVKGGIITSGSCSANNSDLAEAYNSSDDLHPGELVMASGTSATSVIRATQSGQTTLMGIVSTDPSQVIGTAQVPDGHPIALSGRVPVKVNTDGGDVAVGDMITISSIPGIGQKATGAGLVVGTALESFNGEGVGSIEVFVSLMYFNPVDGNNLQAQSSNFVDLNVSGTATIENLTVTSTARFKGNIVIEGHIRTAGTAPAISAKTAAGSGAQVNIEGNDTAGTITITTGTYAVTAGELAKLVFDKQFSATPRIILSGQDGPSVAALMFPSIKSTDGFSLSTEQALSTSTTYTFDYFVLE